MKTTLSAGIKSLAWRLKVQYVKSEDSGHRSSSSRIGLQCQSLSLSFFFFMPISLQKRTTTSSGTYENKKVQATKT